MIDTAVVVEVGDGPERLGFALPPFMRESWVSDAASRAWSSKLRDLSTTTLELALAGVAAGIQPALARRIPGWQIFTLRRSARLLGLGHRFEVVRSSGEPDPERPGLLYYDVLVGPESVLAELEHCGPRRRAELLGIPACCAAAAQAAERRDWAEPVWHAARATGAAVVEGDVVTIAGPPGMNPVLWRLGLRVASHLACRFDCEATRAIVERTLALGLAGPERAAIAELLEVLAWPAEWSGLHGLAELRLPVVRFATSCEATATRFAIRWSGSGYPAEGGRGVRFPFRRVGSAAISDGPVFARGLANPIVGGAQLTQLRLRSVGPTIPARYLDPSIEWARLAEPQADGYDTEVALRLGSRTVEQNSTPPTIVEGKVAVRQCEPEFAGRMGWSPAPLRHPNIDQAVEYLRAWPRAYAQFGELVSVLHPVSDPAVPLERWGQARGSCSHHQMEQRGHIWATIFDPLGLAQAFVHEMAHTKLFDLGLAVESDHTLILNPRSELYASPIRKDRPRPMSAVVHAQYSFIHVTALDLELLCCDPEPRLREAILELLDRNVVRMEEGFEVIERYARTDERGAVFLAAFMRWSAEVIAAGRAALAAHS